MANSCAKQRPVVMKKNWIPAVIAFTPALLLPLVQEAVRPRVPSASRLGVILSWAPDFIVGLCFPFGILIRPRVWFRQTASYLFDSWSVLTLVVLVGVEVTSPFGPNRFDVADIIGAAGGVLAAVLVYYRLVRCQLRFADE